MLSQRDIKNAWGPGCYRGDRLTITLHGGGKVTVRPQIADAVLALDAVLRRFTYVTRAKDTGAGVCRDKVGRPGELSNHAYFTALDINWLLNPMGLRLVTNMPIAMVKAICSIRTRNGAQVWNWGGFWSGSKDAMHFEIVCTPKDIATGIDPRTVPGAPPAGQRHSPPASTPIPAAVPLESLEVHPMTFVALINSGPGSGAQLLIDTTARAIIGCASPQDADALRAACDFTERVGISAQQLTNFRAAGFTG
jgi:hypothetical protein